MNKRLFILYILFILAQQKVVSQQTDTSFKAYEQSIPGSSLKFKMVPIKSGSFTMGSPENENEIWDKKLELKNFAVSTSGDVYRYTIHNGIKYSHIIDPRTGYGVTSKRNVTVITKYGADADWLATACSILPIKKALKLAKKEHAAIFIATLKNEKITIYKSKSLERYFQKKQP